MKGYIKIESATREGKEGLSIDTKLSDVSYMDRIVVVNSVCNALYITPTELKLMAGMIGSGLMDELVDTNTIEDDDDELQEDNKKKPNVHVISGDAEDMLELLRDLLS